MSKSIRGSERFEHVLQVAGQLFAHHGYHATSTREIARISEISENTLFRQFANKEEIFWGALRYKLSALRIRGELLEGIALSRSPEVLLPQLMAQLLDVAFLNPDTLRLVVVAFLEFRWEAANVCGETLLPVFVAVKGYFKTNMEKGKLRSVDAAMLTATLGLSMIAFPEISRLLDGNHRYLENRDTIEAFSRFWLKVLLPDPAESRFGGMAQAAPPVAAE